MFKRSTLTLVIASTSLLATSAFAYTYNPAGKNNFYVSGDVGYSVIETPNKNLLDSSDVSEITAFGATVSQSHDKGYVGAGGNVGYQFAVTPNVLLGTEFGYNYNGRSKYTVKVSEDSVGSASATTTVSSWDLHLLGTGTYLFNNGFNIFAKAGGARVQQTAKGTVDISDFGSETDSDTVTQYKPMVAAGIGYQFKMVNVFAQYSRIFATDASNFNDLVDSSGNQKVASVDAFKLGLAVNVRI